MTVKICSITILSNIGGFDAFDIFKISLEDQLRRQEIFKGRAMPFPERLSAVYNKKMVSSSFLVFRA